MTEEDKRLLFLNRVAKLQELKYQGPFTALEHNIIEGYNKTGSDYLFFQFAEGDIHVYKFNHTET